MRPRRRSSRPRCRRSGTDAALTKVLQSKGVQVNAQNPNPGTSILAEILLGFGPTILLVALFVFLGRRAARAGGGLGGLGNFGRSQARRVDPTTIRVTFDDVAGIDEAKAELAEIVDFLKTPDRYVRLGARIPHGVLLYGQPGTGKTLVARAVAGEAHAAFFSIAASEFIEAIVGVGASRVRDLFAKAKEAAPSIIFIDELDAVGRSRQGSAGITGANDEREQTLDQILTEMDGFDSNAGGRRHRRHEPARDPRPRPAASRPVRPPRRRAAAGQGRAAEDPRGPHPLATAGRRRRPRGARRDDARNGGRRPRQPRQRGRAARRPPQSRQGADVRLHRLPGKDPARRASRDRPRPRGPRADRLPRVGARARRDAHAGGRPRSQGLDHPARPGARRHALHARLRPRLLLHRGARGKDQGLARRTRGGGSRLRRRSRPAPSRTSSS